MCSLNMLFLAMQFAVAFSALPQVQKCQLQNFSCMKTSAQSVVPAVAAGIPEVGAKPLDPIHVDLTNVNLAGLEMVMRDAEIKGLRNTIIDDIRIDMDKKQFQLMFHVNVTLKGKYKASGRLLILPISGDGDVVIKLKNCHVVMNMTLDMVKKNGKDAIELKDYKYSYEVRDSAHFHLTNLFNGNKLLSDAMLKFMNENWKVVTVEFGKPIFDQPMKHIFDALKSYFKSQPLEDIFSL